MLKGDIGPKRNLILLTICLLISVAAAVVCYCLLERQSKKDLNHILAVYSERTENFINLVFHKTDVLAAVVKLEKGNINQQLFNEIAALVYQKDAGIRGIQYMPGAVVTFSFPVKGNEGVIGKNFFQIPERIKDVMLAIDTKSIALSGPYHLIQGGLGVVARNPIFLRGNDGKEHFWGFAAIILDLPDALESVGLNQLSGSGCDFQLFCVNENEERLVIAGNPGLKTEGALLGTIQVPHHQWTLAIKKLNPWGNLLKSAVVLLICLLLSLALWHHFHIVWIKEENARAETRFFSNISHDMRTPLNAIIGFSSLAEKKAVSIEVRDYLTKINLAGNLLLSLINDTLTVSKISSGRNVLHCEPMRTEAITAMLLASTAADAAEKGVNLTIDDTHIRPRTLLIDRLNLGKICINLLSNAVKFTPRGGHVRLVAADGDKPGEIVITVSDDGIGMSPEFLKHLYEPFSQERRPGYESLGTGLGLSIVKQIVTRMGGSISVKSELDRGTTFTVRLHFEETGDAPESGQEMTQAITVKKVLLCEDNELNREIACALLNERDIAVDTAADGQIGVERFTHSAPGEYDVVLMDLRMPVMDGFQATRAIRSLNRPDAGVPIIAMTAEAFEESIRQAKAAGMDGYVTKPFEPQTLFRAIADACARSFRTKR